MVLDRALYRLRQKRYAAAPGRNPIVQHEIAERLLDDLRDLRQQKTAIMLSGAVTDYMAENLRRQQPAAHIQIAAADDDEIFSIPPQSQDAMISNLDLHLRNDIIGWLWQMARALRPDGVLLASLLGAESFLELRQCLLRAEVEIRGGAAARFLPLPEMAACGGLLQRAGLALALIHQETLTLQIADMGRLLAGIRNLGLANFACGRARLPLRRDIIARAQDIYAQEFSTGGQLRCSLQIIYLSGFAPATSQPKPLRPGSAANRLAQALGGVEVGSGDFTTNPASKNR